MKIFDNPRFLAFSLAPISRLIFCLLLITGCAVSVGVTTEHGFQEEDLSQLIGATTDEVRQRLGTPQNEFLATNRTYFVYGTWQNAAGVAFVGILPIPGEGEVKDQLCVLIEFGPDQRVKRYKTSGPSIVFDVWPGSSGGYPCQNVFFWESEIDEFRQVQKEYFERRAQEGNPEAMYRYAVIISADDFPGSFKSFCLAAHMGHARARNVLANRYQFGKAPVQEDLAKSHLWHSLALEAGYAAAVKNKAWVSQNMTSEQTAEAERLVAEWEPNPTECDKIGLRSEN